MSNASTTAKPPTHIAFKQPMPTRKHDALDVRCPRHCKQGSTNTGSYHGKIEKQKGKATLVSVVAVACLLHRRSRELSPKLTFAMMPYRASG
ncbi:hypothetical protein CH063_03230 [Colletotrichum higginsianum]|uniref:Uncharacterized protein n=1 Tax=Colletotrichum higginsianum (strain IMI 349063) TaxID=759273 RepID=H1VV20_COLHI|nr:hypothetical protein CH063_03230 [Colletotrichum higginsianum]